MSDARITVVGAGALGCALLPRLARMRIGTLTLVDGDRVEAANLDHQPLYAEVDVGHPKAGTLRGWLLMVDPGKEIIAVDRFLDGGNAEALLRGSDLVVDCTDDLHAKGLIDHTCAELNIPLVSGAVHEKQGQVIVLHVHGEGSALCRADIFTGRMGAEQDGCDMQRVPLEVIDAVGQRMAACVRAHLNGEPLVNGRIELLDRMKWAVIDAPR